nr:PREDICTED: THAP domain-containing protein 10-like [Bemisia tabaci]
MPKQCSFKNCKNVQISGCEKSFFRFPKDPAIQKIWLSQCNVTACRDNGRICSDPFSTDDFEEPVIFKTSRGRRLKINAIPNLLLTASVDIPESHKSTKVISYYKNFLGQR